MLTCLLGKQEVSFGKERKIFVSDAHLVAKTGCYLTVEKEEVVVLDADLFKTVCKLR